MSEEPAPAEGAPIEEAAALPENRFAPEMTREEYDADKSRVRSTSLKWMTEPNGPAAFYWNTMNPDPNAELSSSMALGTIVHEIVLDGKAEKDVFVVCPCRRDLRTQAYRDFLKANPGKEILTEAQARDVRGMVKSIYRNKDVLDFLINGSFQEQTILWTHRRSGMPAKARLDMVGQYSPHVIVDLKTTRAANQWAFVKDFVKLRYAFSLAFYEQALRAVLPKGDIVDLPRIVAVYSKYPYYCYVYQVTNELMFEGHKAVDAAFARLAQCKKDFHAGLGAGLGVEEAGLLAFPDDEAENNHTILVEAPWQTDREDY